MPSCCVHKCGYSFCVEFLYAFAHSGGTALSTRHSRQGMLSERVKQLLPVGNVLNGIYSVICPVHKVNICFLCLVPHYRIYKVKVAFCLFAIGAYDTFCRCTCRYSSVRYDTVTGCRLQCRLYVVYYIICSTCYRLGENVRLYARVRCNDIDSRPVKLACLSKFLHTPL